MNSLHSSSISFVLSNSDFVNYPPTPKAMGWASGFTALCFFAEVLFIAPPVFSTVPAEFNIFNPSLRMFFAALRSRSNVYLYVSVLAINRTILELKSPKYINSIRIIRSYQSNHTGIEIY